jgi:hypothetical protein
VTCYTQVAELLSVVNCSSPASVDLLCISHVNQPDEVEEMRKLNKTLCVAAVAGVLAIPFTSAQAWWGPWGGGGPWGGDGWGNDGWGDGWGDGSGDFDFNMSGGGHGSGYGRGYGRGYGYGYGYGGYPYGGWGGPYGGWGGPYGGYPGAYGAPYGYAPPAAAPAQQAAPETSK